MTTASTKLIYFDNMWQLHTSAVVVAMSMENERVIVVVDQTIVHPQGGGQPSDKGWICSLDEELKFRVEDARLKNGVIFHYGYFESLRTFKVGQEVLLSIDEVRRDLNSRLHTAGHLLDICTRNVGLTNLEPEKGYHFPDGPSVEYKGTISSNDIESKRVSLEKEMNRLVACGGIVKAFVLPYKDAAALCGGSLPDYIPKDMSPRIVKVGDNVGCPCGGTHVKDISMLGAIKVTQIRVKKGVTRISYNLPSGVQ